MKRTRLAVSSVFFTNGFMFASYVSRLPDIQGHFDLNYQQIGFVLLTGALGSLLAMPMTGGLIERHGSRIVTLLAAISNCILIGLFMYTPGIKALFVLFFFSGIAAGITDVAMNAQAVKVERLYNRPIRVSFHGIFSFGMFAGAGASAAIVYYQISVAHHLWLAATFCLNYNLFSQVSKIKKSDKKGCSFSMN